MLFLGLIIPSCMIFHRDYRNKDYYKITEGLLYFGDNTIRVPNRSIDGFNCYRYIIYDKFNQVNESRDLSIFIRLFIQPYYRPWKVLGPVDGSIEKVQEMNFYFRNEKNIYYFSKYNILLPERIRCFAFVDTSGSLVTASWTKDEPMRFEKRELVFGKVDESKLESSVDMGVRDIDDFITLLNQNYSDQYFFAEDFLQHTFFFQFDKKLFEELKFAPTHLGLEIKLKTPHGRRIRKITLENDLRLSNIKYE